MSPPKPKSPSLSHGRIKFPRNSVASKWEVGRILAFDDTLEHEARNDGDELRVVLIFDVWNPLLTPAERSLVTSLAEAARSFGG